MVTVQVILFGFIIGSFLTACIYRIPRGADYAEMHHEELGDENFKPVSLVEPIRSFCPSCDTPLPWYCNIPVFSWLALKGRCLYCKTCIPVRYIVVELLSGLGALLSYLHFGFTLTGLIIYVFFCALVVISFIDLDFFIIPNVISLPGTLIGIVLAGVNEFFHLFSWPFAEGLLESGLGILVGAGFLFFVAEVYLRLRKIEGLGMGDVKLLAMIGAFFGPHCAGYTIFLGSLIGSVIGMIMILCGGRKMSQHIPFGPYLSLGTFFYLFFAQEVIFSLQYITESFSALFSA
jgi:leader peptidase (prepilin peptidase) / N-methyltransferase